jgi:hypothetical protein
MTPQVARALILILMMVLGCGAPALAQAPALPANVTINELVAPFAPALTLLDKAPTSIERPETPKAFAVNLLNKISEAGGFPRDYALQVAPYWLKSHPDLSFASYQAPNFRQTLARTFAVSIATGPLKAVSGAEPGTQISLGASTQVIGGRANPALPRAVEDLEKVMDVYLDLLAGKPTERQLADAEKAITAQALKIQKLDAQRVGFLLTIAGGQVWDVTGDDVRNTRTGRRGFWMTPAYRFIARCDTECAAAVDLIGVLRILKDEGRDAMTDVGGRLVWKPTRQFNVSVEAVRRRVPGRNDDPVQTSTRATGMLEYRITEDFALYGTFGQDFKKATGVKPLVSLVGLNVGFGNVKVKPR